MVPTVGKEVVVMYVDHPLRHNTEHSPKHPCRGKILKVGRIYAHVQSTGSPIKVRLDGEGLIDMMDIAEAKEKYREDLIAFGRTPAQVDAYVEEL